jgi:hypothetical protein
MIDVSIIIVNFNTKELTLQCIASIKEQTIGITYEIIVVDNASTDGSQEVIENKFPEVKLLSSSDNLGFGNGNNLGVRESCGEYLFFLNSDTILVDNAVLILYDFYRQYKTKLSIAVLGCRLVNAELKQINSCGNFPKIFKDILYYPYALINHFSKMQYSPYPQYSFNESFIKVDMVSGADMFMGRDVFVNIGGFDNRFFMYYEETDLQKRLFSQGFSNYIITNTTIIHLEGGGDGRISNAKRIMIQRSRNLYFKLNESKHYFIYQLIELIINCVRFANPSFTLKENVEFIVENIKSL